jgi:hypothetical protein
VKRPSREEKRSHHENTPEEKKLDLKKEEIPINSHQDMSPLDHPLIHHTTLELRERERFILVKLGI